MAILFHVPDSALGGIDEYTKLMMHMDGADDGTVFTDDSASTHSISRFNAVTKTAVKKFGNASGYFDGTGDYLTAPNSSDFDFGSDDWTVDLWSRQAVAGVSCFIHYGSGSALAQTSWVVYVSTNPANGTCKVWCGNPAATEYNAVNTTADITDGSFHHIAAVRNGADLKIAVDGVFGDTIDIASASLEVYGGAILTLGWWGTTLWYNGYMDELRVSKGIARWTSNFTPPTEQYTT